MPHLAVLPQNRKALTMNVHCPVWMTCPFRRDQSMRTCIPDNHEIGGNEQSNVSKAMSNKLSKRLYFPTSLLRPNQRTNSPNTNGPTALPLQNKGGLHHDVFIARRLLLTRLRAGHKPILKAYANPLDTAIDPKCPCCEEEPQTVEHWQWCPYAVALI